MAIFYYSLTGFKPVSKPRGQLNKYGKMTHSLGGYRLYQDRVANRLKLLKFNIPRDFIALGYIFHMKPAKGQKNDLTNMVGALEDIFVKYKYLPDDNWSVIQRCWCEAIPCATYGITILVITTDSSLTYFFSHRQEVLSKFT